MVSFDTITYYKIWLMSRFLMMVPTMGTTPPSGNTWGKVCVHRLYLLYLYSTYSFYDGWIFVIEKGRVLCDHEENIIFLVAFFSF